MIVSDSEAREALFKALASHPGGVTAALIHQDVLRKAEAAVLALQPLITNELRQSAETILALSEAKEQTLLIAALAHDIRGLAGICGLDGAGLAAGALRAYCRHFPDSGQPDWRLLRLLGATIRQAIDHPDSVDSKSLVETCKEAVVKTMIREGRQPPDQPW